MSISRTSCPTLRAALIVLAALAAAPYLTAGNPADTIYPGCLLCLAAIACVAPVRHALERQPRSALRLGCVFGLIFSLCLSLGAELRAYDQLLPGLISLARRIVMPLLAAPFIGVFVSYIFTFFPSQKDDTHRKLPYLLYFLLFSACYGAVLLALYPGVISYDFTHEIEQFSSGIYYAAHPVFHTLLLSSVFQLGESLFGSMTAGAVLYNAMQLLLLAAMYAWACCFLQRRVPLYAALVAAAMFALLPFHGVLAVSTAKDTLFAGLCVMLCLLLWEIAEDPSAFLGGRLRILRFALVCLLLSLLRHNGVFAFAPACLALIPLCRSRRCRAAVLCAATLAVSLLVPRGLEAAVGAVDIPGSELMSIPCQQLMRTANRAELTEHEFAQIERWFPGATHTYRPHCADPAKGGNFNFARMQDNAYDFISTYGKYALRYPRIYIEAFLENCVGLWYPDDISHAHSLSNEEWEYIYLNTVYPFAEGQYDIQPGSRFPALQKVIYATMHDSVHQKVPFLAQLYCPATYTFALLLLTMRLLANKRKQAALSAAPLWGFFLSLLFSAGVFIRYTYPLMAAVPVLLILTLFAPAAQADRDHV